MNKLTPEQILQAVQSDTTLANALATQLGLKYLPRARVSTPTSKKGNVYLSLRDGRANMSIMPSRNADGSWLVFGGRGRNATPFPYKVGISKDGKSLICSVNFVLQSDGETKLVKDFLAGKIKPAKVEPQEPETAEPEATETTDATEAPAEVDEPETPTAKPSGKATNAQSEEIKMAKELVDAGEYKSLKEALTE